MVKRSVAPGLRCSRPSYRNRACEFKACPARRKDSVRAGLRFIRYLPNRALAFETHVSLAVPDIASHFSIATL